MQILALLLGGLAVSQVLTLVVVLLLPPPPPSFYSLDEVAAALRGEHVQVRDGRPLIVTLEAEPAHKPGSRRNALARQRLADLLGRPLNDVVLNDPDRGRPRFPWGAATLIALPMPGPPMGQGPSRRRSQREEGPPPAEAPPPPGPPMGRFGLDFGPPPDEGMRRPPPPPRNDPRGGEPAYGRPPWQDAFLVRDFVAAVRQPQGGWRVVKPERRRFPTSWQRRVMLWFLACLTVLSLAAYSFARRLTAPIAAFARAAEQLGKHPSAPPMRLSGPAEIGVAARAFNDMQERLGRYVADRTAMMGAIAHDLRTPLTRLRFRLESAPEALRLQAGADVDEMEAMIAAVLAFVRDASRRGERRRLDLNALVSAVADDAAVTGAQVDVAASPQILILGDPLALRRAFANLVGNAVKYGGSAHVSLRREDGEAVVEVRDDGPGLPQDELERVFEPFYRTEPSRSRETGGIGLGLTVARTIVRAHGGELKLSSGRTGLTATARLPLAAD